MGDLNEWFQIEDAMDKAKQARKPRK